MILWKISIDFMEIFYIDFDVDVPIVLYDQLQAETMARAAPIC